MKKVLVIGFSQIQTKSPYMD